MEFIVENWVTITALIVLCAVAGVAICSFFKLPKSEQLEAVREWLLMAVTVAEKELGGGTGVLKLRYVYDMFVARFPWVAKLMSFDMFAELVDEALVEMREMLAQNEAAKEYVEKVGF